MDTSLDFEQISREFLASIRGKRSQIAWSRRLGYRSNVAYTWESGRRWPTAAETLRACSRAGIDVRAALATFYGARQPAWLGEVDVTTPEAAALLMEDLRGTTPILALAGRSGLSRFALSRWLSGQTQPRLPDFLRVVEAASLRVVDFLAAFADPRAIPSVTATWERLEARRQGADKLPWTQAVLHALELEAYRAQPAHEPGWIARRLGISEEEEARCLAFLRLSGQVEWSGTHYHPLTLAVDTRHDPAANRRLKAHWARVGAERAEHDELGQFSYSVFTVSRADFERIREAHLRYFHTLRAIVAESSPDEVVAVANVQLFLLGG